jgi:protein-disulfide isomerase
VLILGLCACAKDSAHQASTSKTPEPAPNVEMQPTRTVGETESSKVATPDQVLALAHAEPVVGVAPKSEGAMQKPFEVPKTPEARKELERKPGLTPALATHTVKPGAKHPSLKGMPGPSPGHGPEDALVKIFVFNDFQCPVCRRAVEPLKAVAREFPKDVQIIVKHNALEMHPKAAGAAAASIAAFRQGKFWEYHDKLFQNNRALHEQDLLLYAEELGLDMGRFKNDIDDSHTKAQILYERELATALGARGTPGFFINGKKTVGWGSYTGFRASVKKALGEAKALAARASKGEDISRFATRANSELGQKFEELVWGSK